MEEKSNLCIEQLLAELEKEDTYIASLRQCISSHIVLLSSHNIQEFATYIDFSSTMADDTSNDVSIDKENDTTCSTTNTKKTFTTI